MGPNGWPAKLRPIWKKLVPARWLPTIISPAAFWTVFGSFEDMPIELSPWEVAHMNDYSVLRARVKAPQIGFSLSCAMEAVHEALVYEDSYTVFVSVDQREAAEKVLYAKKLFDGLPPVFQSAAPIVKDAYDALWFGSTTRPARVESIPQTAALRGRRGNVVLDESDFSRDGGLGAFRIAIGRISLGGRVTVGSTVWGSDTLLDRITRESMVGEDDDLADIRTKFSTAWLPWSVVTRQDQLSRIELAESTLEDFEFAEEYECIRGGRGADTFDAELMRSRTHGDPIAVEVDGRIVFDDEDIMIGYDVGEVRNPSVLSAFAHRGEEWQQVAIYLPQGEDGRVLPLPDQEQLLYELLNANRRIKIVIDAKGIGASIGLKMQRRFGERRVILFRANTKPIGLPSMDRYEVCVELKRQLEAAEFWLMPDRTQYDEFRRTRLISGRVEQHGARKDSHFDVFWADAMASYGIAMSRRVISVPPPRDEALVM